MSTDRGILRARKGVAGVGRQIAQALDLYECTVGYRPAQRFEEGATVINYGRSQWPIWWRDDLRMINSPDAVAVSCNKISTFEALDYRDVPAPAHTTDKNIATYWLEVGIPVVVRHTVVGKGGAGVELVKPGEDLPDAPLYVAHYDKTHEFRVHVAGDDVITYVQKKRMGSKKLKEKGLDEADPLLRNYKRGWVFCYNNIIHSDLVKDIGLRAIKAVGLDYGAADIMATVIGGVVTDAVVCEVNSAPGMDGPTNFNAYVDYFKQQINA